MSPKRDGDQSLPGVFLDFRQRRDRRVGQDQRGDLAPLLGLADLVEGDQARGVVEGPAEGHDVRVARRGLEPGFLGDGEQFFFGGGDGEAGQQGEQQSDHGRRILARWCGAAAIRGERPSSPPRIADAIG
jgi:hypothetical protein